MKERAGGAGSRVKFPRAPVFYQELMWCHRRPGTNVLHERASDVLHGRASEYQTSKIEKGAIVPIKIVVLSDVLSP